MTKQAKTDESRLSIRFLRSALICNAASDCRLDVTRVGLAMLALWLVVALSVVTTPSHAATTWTGGTANWFTATNPPWSSGVPDAADDVTISNDGEAQIDAAGALTRILRISNSASDGTVTQTAGSLTVNNNMELGFNTGGTGTYTITGGTFGFAGGNFNLTMRHNSVFNHGAGVGLITVPGSVSIGDQNAAGTNTYNLNGNTLTTGFDFSFGTGRGANVRNFNFGGNGTLNVGRELKIGGNTTVPGTGITIAAGQTVDVGDEVRLGESLAVGERGFLTLSGGSLTVAGTIYVGNTGTQGDAELNLNSGTYTQTGGELRVERSGTVNQSIAVTVPSSISLGTNNGSGTVTYTLNGVTLQNSANDFNFATSRGDSARTFTLTGANSAIDIFRDVNIGGSTTAITGGSGITIGANQSLSAGDNISIGNNLDADERGYLTLDGGSITSGNSVYVGNNGTKGDVELNLNSGTFTMSSGNLEIQRSGEINQSIAVTVPGTVQLGTNGGSGTVTYTLNGVTLETTTGDLNFATSRGDSERTFTLTGANSILDIDRDVNIGGSTTAITGGSGITIGANQSLLAGDNISIGKGLAADERGYLTLNGGTITAGNTVTVGNNSTQGDAELNLNSGTFTMSAGSLNVERAGEVNQSINVNVPSSVGIGTNGNLGAISYSLNGATLTTGTDFSFANGRGDSDRTFTLTGTSTIDVGRDTIIGGSTTAITGGSGITIAANQQLLSGDEIRIGHGLAADERGYLTLNGGTITAGNTVSVGNNSITGDAELNLNSGTFTMSAGNLNVERAGEVNQSINVSVPSSVGIGTNGSLGTISYSLNGATLTTGSDFSFATGRGDSDRTFTLTGAATIDVGNDTKIGGSTTAITGGSGITIGAGQQLLSDDEIRIGHGLASDERGYLTLDGGTITAGNTVSVGNNGTFGAAELNLLAGTFTMSSGNLESLQSGSINQGIALVSVPGSVTLANESGGTVSYSLNGNTLTTGSHFTFSNRGGTDLTTFDFGAGGTLNVGGNLVLRSNNNGAGAGFTLNSGDLMTVTGTTNVANRSAPAETGFINVYGGTFNPTGDVTVGQNTANGFLRVSAGGTVTGQSVNTDLFLTRNATADVSGGSVSFGDIIVGNNGSASAVFLQSDGTVTTSDDVDVAANGVGSYTLTGGTLIVGDRLDLTDTQATFTLNGGTLSAVTVDDNNTTSNFNFLSGTLSPGSSPGTMTFQDDLTFPAGGEYLAEIASAVSNDLLVVDGDADISLGILTVDLLGGFEPAPLDSFTVLTAGTLTGEFSNTTSGTITIPSGPLGWWTADVTTTMGAGGSVVLSNFEFVPEPATFALAAVGLLGLLRRHRRA